MKLTVSSFFALFWVSSSVTVNLCSRCSQNRFSQSLQFLHVCVLPVEPFLNPTKQKKKKKTYSIRSLFRTLGPYCHPFILAYRASPWSKKIVTADLILEMFRGSTDLVNVQWSEPQKLEVFSHSFRQCIYWGPFVPDTMSRASGLMILESQF